MSAISIYRGSLALCSLLSSTLHLAMPEIAEFSILKVRLRSPMENFKEKARQKLFCVRGFFDIFIYDGKLSIFTDRFHIFVPLSFTLFNFLARWLHNSYNFSPTENNFSLIWVGIIYFHSFIPLLPEKTLLGLKVWILNRFTRLPIPQRTWGPGRSLTRCYQHLGLS